MRRDAGAARAYRQLMQAVLGCEPSIRWRVDDLVPHDHRRRRHGDLALGQPLAAKLFHEAADARELGQVAVENLHRRQHVALPAAPVCEPLMVAGQVAHPAIRLPHHHPDDPQDAEDLVAQPQQ
eukprot:3443081-Prymnesium_polylepis.1